MPNEEIDRLRSVLAHAYEKRQPLLWRLNLAVKDRVRSPSPKPVIEVLNIEKEKEPLNGGVEFECAPI